jgi:hypothetical protein
MKLLNKKGAMGLDDIPNTVLVITLSLILIGASIVALNGLRISNAVKGNSGANDTAILANRTLTGGITTLYNFSSTWIDLSATFVGISIVIGLVIGFFAFRNAGR